MEIGGNLTWPDILSFTLYFCFVVSIGLYVIIKQRRGNVQNYFLAGRTMPWYAVGGSLFSSNNGTEMILALSGAGAAAGISLVMYEWLPIFIIMIFSWYLLPVYISAGVYTLPEYMEKRYGGNRLRNYLSVVSIVIIIVSKMVCSLFLWHDIMKIYSNFAVNMSSYYLTVMFSGSIFIQVAIKWNMYVAIAALLVVSMVFTTVGGLKAVMVIGALQTLMVLAGGVVIMILSFERIGGYQNLETLYAESVPHVRSNNTTCGLPRHDAFHVFQHVIEGDQPWPGLVLQASLGGLYNWCCNQLLIQRSLAAKSLSHAKAGAIMLSLMKILPLFLTIFPGMISRILFPDEVACADADVCMRICDNPAGCSNIAYPMLILGLLPVGVRGLFIAVMISGIMITISSVTNSTSTVFAMDVWRKIRPAAKQRELLLVGRVSVIVFCTVAIMWVPFVKAFQNGRLFSYMLSVGGYLGSPLGALFCLSVMWKKLTEQGVFWSLIASHLLGVIRLVVELIYPAPPCGEDEDNRIFISRLHYTYFIQIQIAFAVIVSSLISQITKRRSDEQLEGVTWWTRVKPCDEEDHEDTDLEIEIIRRGTLTPGKEERENLKQDTASTNKPLEQAEPTLFQRVSAFLCGANEEVEEGAHFDMELTKAFLREDANTASLLNLLSVTLMIVVGFVIGYFR